MEAEIKNLVQLLTLNLKSVIVVHWKQKNEFQVYRNLSVFTDRHKDFDYDAIDYNIGRNNRPYETDEVKVCRLYVIGKDSKEPKMKVSRSTKLKK